MKKLLVKKLFFLIIMIGLAFAISFMIMRIKSNHVETTANINPPTSSLSHEEAFKKAKESYEDEERRKEAELEASMKAYAEEKYYEEISLAEKLELDKPITSESTDSSKWFYSITSADYTNLVMAIQHETGNDPNFYNGDFDLVQQYMAKSILNRLGKPGFGVNYGTAYTVYDLLSNQVQYGNMLEEMWAFDPDDERTKKNLDKVLSGQDNLPNDLYYERCSTIGASYAEAIEDFLYNYPDCKSMEVVYMSPTKEGRYIIFATNPFGAYAG